MNSLSIKINGRDFLIDLANPLDIAIPLKFNGAQPNAYGVEKATSEPCAAGEIVGDTRRGGSCNFEKYAFIPHCSGTHTECVGHITDERISVHDCLKDAFVPAVLISLEPETAAKTKETYVVDLQENDALITRRTIENALQEIDANNPQSEIRNPKSLVVRTLPNDEGKLRREYLDKIPPFFSTEAMQLIMELNFKHLLVDLPSIDRIFDEGKLSNHRIFWNVEPGSRAVSEKSLINHTITELIYVPDAIADGNYLLNLQIAAFAADASPSRPTLFELKVKS